MPTHTIFYSWQSDLPNSVNRGFIEDCLQRAVKELQADEALRLDPCLDRDTSGVPGSPDIAATIFDKIKAADVFVGDVTFIDQGAGGRRTPNPNVLVELGYAAGWLGWDRIICVFNRAFGDIGELPFDLRTRRVRSYDLSVGEEKVDKRKVLVSVLKDDIASILHAPDKAKAAALQDLLSTLATELIDVTILGTELEDRQINPWLDSLLFQFGETANNLRQLANSDTAVEHSMNIELEELAVILDEAAHYRLNSGAWPGFSGIVNKAVETARAIKAARIDGVPLAAESLIDIRSTIVNAERNLCGLAARAINMVNQGRIDDFQAEASGIGLTLLRVGSYEVDLLQPGLSERLQLLGRDLHLVETMQVFCDGGRSVNAIVERVKQGAGALTELVKSLPPLPGR